MSSTTKSLKFNTRERALSTDFNRGQAFSSHELAMFARSLLLSYYPSTGTPYYSMNESYPDPLESDRPIRGVVLHGLHFYPINGTTDALITAGQVLQVQLTADVGADDYNVVMVDDEGVQSTGTLTLTPNSSGTGRVDIVECKVINYDYETSSRDVYDPGTGLFTVASLVKVTGKKLEYRIRTGSASSAWPGLVDGWMPIAVLVVPDGTTDFDGVDIFDVRPLVGARANDITEVSENTPKYHEVYLAYDLTDQHKIKPIIDVSYRTQRVRWGDGTAVASSPLMIDVQDTANYDPTWTPSASQFWFMYLAFPFGLPRWAKYSDATTSPRKPQREGIPIITNKISGTFGTTAYTMSLPTASGLVGTVQTTELFCVTAGWVDAGGTVRGTLGSKGKFWISPQSASNPNVSAGTHTASLARFPTRQIIPPNAKKARIRVALSYTYTPGSDDEVPLMNKVNNAMALYPTTTTAIQENLHFSADSTFLKSGTGYTLLVWTTIEVPGYCDLEVDTIFGTSVAPTPNTAIAYLVDWSIE